MDSGAENNFIDQSWTKENLDDIVTQPKHVRAIDGHKVFAYGQQKLRMTAEDTGGLKRTTTQTWEAVDIAGYDAILGFPWFKSVNPEIDWSKYTWTYRQTKSLDEVEIIHAAKADRELRKGMMAFLVYPNEFLNSDPQDLAVLGATISFEENRAPSPDYVQEYADVFSEEAAGVLPAHADHDHAIELAPGSNPPYRPIYNLSEPERAVLRDYIKTALAKGWIRPSKSPAGAPVLFVPKKDGGLRLCVDYRGLNAATIKNRYALPLIGETLDQLAGAKIFTQLDLRDAYHRIRIREGDEWKTAFRTRYGHFEYTVMPFGLTNAPATFQAYINKALSDMLDLCVVVYLDDILIYSMNEEDHERNVRMVLDRLRAYNLYCKLSKCAFNVDTVNFLGFVVSPKGIHMEPARVETVEQWPEPTCARDIQVFLGFTNFYRRFVEGYSRLTAPLTELTKGATKGKSSREPFQLGKEARKAFFALKERFLTAPILTHFDVGQPICVETDALDFAIAGILSQVQEDKQWHPVAFWSRKMQGAERHYETHDKELLAIVESFKRWRHYLEGSQFPVRVLCDHANLRYFMTTKELNGRQIRWAEKLAGYDFYIEYRPGGKNPADAPSRRPDYETAEEEADETILPTLKNKLKYGAFENSHEKPFVFMIKSAHQRSVRPEARQSHGCTQRGDPMEACRNGQNDPVDAYSGARGKAVEACDVGLWMNETPRQRGQHQRGDCEDPMETALWKPADAQSDPAEAYGGGCHMRTPMDDQESHSSKGTNVDERSITSVTRGPELWVPRLMATQALQTETAYSDMPEPMSELLCRVQQADTFSKERCEELQNLAGRGQCRSDDAEDSAWSIGRDGLLRYERRVYVPKDPAIIAEIMRINHDDPQGGHFAYKRTLEAIKRKYFWHDLAKDIEEYTSTCAVCQRVRVHRHKPYGMLEPVRQPTRPMETTSMDFITGLPPCRWEGKVVTAIFVIIDTYTKFAIYLPCRKEINAEDLAELFYS